MFAGTTVTTTSATKELDPVALKKAELDIARWGIYIGIGSLLISAFSLLRRQ